MGKRKTMPWFRTIKEELSGKCLVKTKANLPGIRFAKFVEIFLLNWTVHYNSFFVLWLQQVIFFWLIYGFIIKLWHFILSFWPWNFSFWLIYIFCDRFQWNYRGQPGNSKIMGILERYAFIIHRKESLSWQRGNVENFMPLN